MVHISPDYQSKKDFKQAVKDGVLISIYSPGLSPVPANGRAVVEAPANYHKWYATVVVKDGYVTKVVS